MQPARNRIVAHFKDGRLLKGYTHDFVPERESFHISEASEAGAGATHSVNVAELKALFFVKSFEGNPAYREKSAYAAEPRALHGIKIKVEFYDGEVIRGLSLGYTKAKKGFFIIPADPASNNERIYIVASSTTRVTVGPGAEE